MGELEVHRTYATKLNDRNKNGCGVDSEEDIKNNQTTTTPNTNGTKRQQTSNDNKRQISNDNKNQAATKTKESELRR